MTDTAQTETSRSYQIFIHAPAETYALGQALGRLLGPGQTVALHGDLGAGKTLLTQGIAAGLGITARVTSPTFMLVNEYTTPDQHRLIHIDSYRLGDQNITADLDAATFGLEEILDRDDAIVVIEWAERVAALLPADYLQITIDQPETDATARAITLKPHGPISRAVLQSLIAESVGANWANPKARPQSAT